MTQNTNLLFPILKGQAVIPVLLIDEIANTVPLARALVAGGLPTIEITLRTAVAIDAIRAVAEEVPEAIVGAGTVLNARQYEDATKAGSRFVVSPGATQKILDMAQDHPVPLLPGVMTPSEIMVMREKGYTYLKFFPAEYIGGISFLKALSSPFSGMVFCPTGGISVNNVKSYLSLPNVICVGGSWVAPAELVNDHRWDQITMLAANAAKLLH